MGSNPNLGIRFALTSFILCLAWLAGRGLYVGNCRTTGLSVDFSDWQLCMLFPKAYPTTLGKRRTASKGLNCEGRGRARSTGWVDSHTQVPYTGPKALTDDLISRSMRIVHKNHDYNSTDSLGSLQTPHVVVFNPRGASFFRPELSLLQVACGLRCTAFRMRVPNNSFLSEPSPPSSKPEINASMVR